jgi:hypothetical protein
LRWKDLKQLILSWDAMGCTQGMGVRASSYSLNNPDVPSGSVSVLQSDAKFVEEQGDGQSSISKSAEAVFHYD